MLLFVASAHVAVLCTSEPPAQLPFSSKVRFGSLLIESTARVSHTLRRRSADFIILLSNQLLDLVPYLLLARLGNRAGTSVFILPALSPLQFPVRSFFHPNNFKFFSSFHPHRSPAAFSDSPPPPTSFSPNCSQCDLSANLSDGSCLTSFK